MLRRMRSSSVVRSSICFSVGGEGAIVLGDLALLVGDALRVAGGRRRVSARLAT